jgi:plastocyanin
VQRSRCRRAGHPGLLAAATVLAASGLVGVVGVAGAAEDQVDAHVYARDNSPNPPCFSTVETADTCQSGETASVEIVTGESVTWHFAGGAGGTPGLPHNAVDDPVAPTWTVPDTGQLVTSGSFPRIFTQPGVYEFVCQAHPTMTGTVTVTGEPIETPTPTQTPAPTETASPSPQPTVSATPTPTPPPSNGGHVTTPAPTRGTDTVDPAVGSVRLTARRRAVRVRFRLSEPATVTIRIKRRGSRKVLKSARVQAAAGTRTVTLRSRKLKKGRYTVDIRARDAGGNLSSLTTKRLTIT